MNIQHILHSNTRQHHNRLFTKPVVTLVQISRTILSVTTTSIEEAGEGGVTGQSKVNNGLVMNM